MSVELSLPGCVRTIKAPTCDMYLNFFSLHREGALTGSIPADYKGDAGEQGVVRVVNIEGFEPNPSVACFSSYYTIQISNWIML